MACDARQPRKFGEAGVSPSEDGGHRATRERGGTGVRQPNVIFSDHRSDNEHKPLAQAPTRDIRPRTECRRYRNRHVRKSRLTAGDSVLARAKTIDRGLAGQAWGGDRQYSSRGGSCVRVTAGRLEGRYRRRAAITTSLEYVSARLSGSTVHLPARTNPRAERRAPPRRAPTARAATILAVPLRAQRLTSGPLLMSIGR